MFMKGNGKMIKHMERVFILTLMALAMKVTGKRISNTDTELNNGLMVPATRASM